MSSLLFQNRLASNDPGYPQWLKEQRKQRQSSAPSQLLPTIPAPPADRLYRQPQSFSRADVRLTERATSQPEDTLRYAIEFGKPRLTPDNVTTPLADSMFSAVAQQQAQNLKTSAVQRIEKSAPPQTAPASTPVTPSARSSPTPAQASATEPATPAAAAAAPEQTAAPPQATPAKGASAQAASPKPATQAVSPEPAAPQTQAAAPAQPAAPAQAAPPAAQSQVPSAVPSQPLAGPPDQPAATRPPPCHAGIRWLRRSRHQP